MAELLEGLAHLDFAAFQWLRRLQHPLLTTVFAGLSDLARASMLWMVLAVLALPMRPARWPAALQLVLALLITTAAVDLVAKPLAGRARPFVTYAGVQAVGALPTTLSMPSGHAASAAAAAYGFTRFLPEMRGFFWCLAALVGLSRIYLGVHYPADVLAGGLLGLSVAWVVIGGTRWRW